MNRALMKHTQVAVVLAVNVITHTDDDARLLTLPLIRLTPVVFALLAIGEWAAWQWCNLCEFAGIITESARLTNVLFIIGFKSLLFGFTGVNV